MSNFMIWPCGRSGCGREKLGSSNLWAFDGLGAIEKEAKEV